MVADHPGLNPARPDPAQGSAWLALGLLLPLLAWTVTTLMASLDLAPDRAAFLLEIARGLLLAQALVIALCLGWFAALPGWQGTLCGPALMALAPLPLLVLLGHMSELAPLRLLQPILLLALGMATLAAGLRLLVQPLRQAPARHLLLTACSLLITAQAWTWRDDWLGWIAP